MLNRTKRAIWASEPRGNRGVNDSQQILDKSIFPFIEGDGIGIDITGQDKVNPGSLILSAEMMLRHMGWNEAAEMMLNGMRGAIKARTVTCDFERLMDGATLVKCSEFGQAMIDHMDA